MNQFNTPNNLHILIIDDDKKIASLLKQILAKHGFIVLTAFNNLEAMETLYYFKCDLILLDYMLGEVNGVELLQTIREKHILTPIIMLTAVNEIDIRLESLSVGADDYISKPFHSEELILRIKNLLKRAQPSDNNEIVNFSDLEFNRLTGELHRNNQLISLSTQEEQLLQIFTAKLGQIVSKEEILKATHKALTEENLNTINVNIMRLRKKIDASESAQTCLKTVRNQGFLLKP